MARKSWPPTKVTYEWVMSLYNAMKQEYATIHANMTMCENAYDGKLDLGIRLPEGVPHHIPSTATAKIDNAAANIITDFPHVNIKKPGGGVTAEKRQVKLEKLGAYYLDRIRHEFNYDVFAAAKTDALLYGAYCYKAVFDETQWPDPPDTSDVAELREWERDRKTAFPFFIRAVNPRTVFVPRDGRWPHTFAIEEQTRLAIDMWTEYPEWRDPKARQRGAKPDPARRVLWLEYWDCENYIAFADGEEVFRRKNPLYVTPYVWQPVSRGSRDEMPKGLLLSVFSELQAQARLHTAADIAWQFYVFPRMLVKKDEAEQVQAAWNTGPGGVIPVEKVHGEERSVNWLDMPQISPAMWNFMPTVEQSIDRATFNETLLGERPTGVDYGVHQGMLVNQARQSLRPFVDALNRGTGNLVNLLFMQTEYTLNEEILVNGETHVTPHDINGHYQAHVTFEAVDKADDDRRAQLGISILRSGALPLKVVLSDYFNREDPEQDIIARDVERVVQQLIDSGTLQAVVMRSANFDEAKAQLDEEVSRATGESAKLSQGRGPLPPIGGASPAFGELSNRMVPGEVTPARMRGDENPQ